LGDVLSGSIDGRARSPVVEAGRRAGGRNPLGQRRPRPEHRHAVGDRRFRAKERQHASEGDFTQTVEEITGRKVRAFVSGVDTKRDVSSEVFYFEPVAAPS
jgi:hypothetical protein